MADANPFDQFDPPWERYKSETGSNLPPWEHYPHEKGEATTASTEANPFDQFDPPSASQSKTPTSFSELANAYGRLQGLGARTTWGGLAKTALSAGTLPVDAMVNAGYGLHKLAAKTGAVSEPNADFYYGKGGSYLPATAGISDAVNDGLDKIAETVPGVGGYLRAPETRSERMLSAVGEGAVGAMTGVGLGRALATNGTSAARAVGGLLADRAGLQMTSAAASGAAGQGVAEAGGDGKAQLIASVLAGAATGAAGARMTRSAAPGPRPTADIEAAKTAAYGRSEAEGITFTNRAGQELNDRVRQRLQDAHIYADTSPEVRRVLEPLDRTVGPNAVGVRSDIPLERMEDIRKVASKMRSSPNPTERRSGAILADEIGGFIGERNPSRVTATSGNLNAAVDALEEGRAGTRHLKQAQAFDLAVDKADLRRKSTGTGTNYNTTRQNLRAIVENPESRAFRQFDPPQIAAMRDYVEGSSVQNGLRYLSSFAPKGTVSGMGAMIAAKSGFGAVPAVGFMAKALHDKADARTLANIESLIKDGPGGARPRPSARTRVNASRGAGQGFMFTDQGDERPGRGRYR